MLSYYTLPFNKLLWKIWFFFFKNLNDFNLWINEWIETALFSAQRNRLAKNVAEKTRQAISKEYTSMLS